MKVLDRLRAPGRAKPLSPKVSVLRCGDKEPAHPGSDAIGTFTLQAHRQEQDYLTAAPSRNPWSPNPRRLRVCRTHRPGRTETRNQTTSSRHQPPPVPLSGPGLPKCPVLACSSR